MRMECMVDVAALEPQAWVHVAGTALPGTSVSSALLEVDTACELAPAVSPLEGVSNGATVFAMRHRKKGARLNRPADQRKALIRGLVTDVLKYGSITTTKVRQRPSCAPHVEHPL